MLGQHDLALADYTKAIARRPNFAMAFINRAWVEQVVGQEAAALADADKAYTLDPNSAQVRDMRDQIYAKARQRTASVAPAATATGFNGDWRGDSSGNLVRIETRTNGLFVTPVSQNAGQSAQGILYTTSTATTFRYNRDSVIEVLGPAQIRVTNADGWTDVFRPVRSSAAQYQQPQPPAAPQTGECIGSNDYCYAIKHGCTPGVCMAPPGWNGSLLLPPRSLRPERRRATADAVERA
jgi:tetratricopeptide (TPR) repeat protein